MLTRAGARAERAHELEELRARWLEEARVADATEAAAVVVAGAIEGALLCVAQCQNEAGTDPTTQVKQKSDATLPAETKVAQVKEEVATSRKGSKAVHSSLHAANWRRLQHSR